MFIFAIITTLVVGYIGAAVIPNLFVRRGIAMQEHPNCVIVAHRGGADLAAENTLECIEKGIAAGADAIEIDIHLSKDNRLIVCHDQTVNRTTNGKGLIRDFTLSELKELRIKDANGKITEQQLPTLEEILTLINGRVQLLIEVKRTGNIYQGLEKELLETLHKHQATSWCTVQSFNDSVLENIHSQDRNIRLEKLIVCKFPGLPFIFDGSFRAFNFKKYSYISSFNFYYLAVSQRLIDKIHQAGKEVKIWTLKDPAKVPNLPVDGIITDRPDLYQSVTPALSSDTY